MKNKYQRLTKEEKKECRNMYYKTQKGKEMHARFIRLTTIGLIGILFGVYILINGVTTNKLVWYDYLMAIPLILASLIFLIGTNILRKKVLNQFALKIPRFKNK